MIPTFYQKVYQIVKQIPAGRVMTYRQVAQMAGNSKAFRAVGTAMRLNPDKDTIPCHRVVGSDGSMHGYAFGLGVATKVELLKKEGVFFKGDKVDLILSHNV